MSSNHLFLCCPLLLLPSIINSIRLFSTESVLHFRWPKYWSFSISIGFSNEYSRLISFRIDWLDSRAVQGTLKSLLQHHSSKALILQHSAFFIIQLSHPHMTSGKTIALTRRTFVGTVMSLLFNQFILCLPLLFLPSIFPSIRDFSNESTLPIKWPKYCSFSFRISPSNEYSGMISFRIDWFDFFFVQGTLRSLLQHHSSKASALQYSTFFMVQLSYPYMTTGKTIALTIRTYLSWQIDGENVETGRFYFFGLPNHCGWWLQPWNSKTLTPWKESYDQPR